MDTYIRFLPAYMINKKYEEYISVYDKYYKLYTTMRDSRALYNHLNEIEYYDKLEYYKRMFTIYKNKAGTCRKYQRSQGHFNLKNKEKGY